MKRILLFGLVMLLVIALNANAGEGRWPGKTVIVNHNEDLRTADQISRRNNTDVIIFDDDFEGEFLWTTHDLTADPGAWHIDTYHAYGGSGRSWWCADRNLHGYRDDWYMALETPQINLAGTTNPILTFQSNYACEGTAGTTPPWDGWDGMNIRISTNNGASWTILGNDVVDPDYTANSLYSFGLQHGEGTNIPGWTGDSSGWYEVTANLSAYVDQTIRIRFAFASDRNTCTIDHPEWFGWQVDEIEISDSIFQIYYHTGEDSTGFRNVNAHVIGGDLWHLETWTQPAPPSPTHVLRCGTVGGSYNPNMNNAVESSYIDLRSYVSGVCAGDFMISGDITDPNPSPNIDRWCVEITPDSGIHWFNVTNPWGSPTGTNYVFASVPSTWQSFVGSYMNANLDFSEYLGYVCLFRIVLKSDGDVPTGVGLLIDDVWIDYSSALQNDCGCTALHVPFPTAVNFQTHGEAEYSNLGSTTALTVLPYWQVQGSSAVLLPPITNLQVGIDSIRSFDWTPITTGTYWLKAWTYYLNDQNPLNDTCRAFNVEVSPQNQLVLGYDNRTAPWSFNYATNIGAACRFTPGADGIPGAFNVMQARFLFSENQTTTESIDLVILEGDASEVPGAVITTIPISVTPVSETNPNWKTVDLSGVSALQNRTNNFWLWLKVTNTSSGNRFPKIMGDDQMWGDGHFFIYSGTAAAPSTYDYMIRTMVTPTVGVDDEPLAHLPNSFYLAQNYPNPFNPITNIRFNLPHTSPVTIKVFNLMGQEVATLIDRNMSAGTHNVQFDAHDLPSGIYFYKIEASDFTDIKKMVLLK